MVHKFFAIFYHDRNDLKGGFSDCSYRRDSQARPLSISITAGRRYEISGSTEEILSALEAHKLIKGAAAKRKMLQSLGSSLEKGMQSLPPIQSAVH